MSMPARVRKLVLTTHVVVSVGWLGAVAVFVALAVVALTARETGTARGVLLVMEPAAWYTLVPLSAASLATGVTQSLATPWGLFQHYWVVFKLLINLATVVVLLMYMQTLATLADMAASPDTSDGQLQALAASPLIHGILALLALLAATALSVYKPKGLTRHGRRVRRRSGGAAARRPATAAT